jgi:glycosyltransferase involved in cell wall biosynthesis
VVSFMGDDLLGTPGDDGAPTLISRVLVELNRRFAAVADAVIVKSHEMARVISPTPCHVIPNGVDLHVFRPMDRARARRELGWDVDRRYVLFPGNPDERRKGHRLAIQTIEQLECDVELVPLWGITPDRVPLFMNACNAMLLCSAWEGSPNVVKEAMACDLPVVATPVGDVGELLKHTNGNAMSPPSPGSLAEALSATFSGPQRSSGRARLVQLELSLEDVAARVIEVYRDVLSSASARRARSAEGTR